MNQKYLILGASVALAAAAFVFLRPEASGTTARSPSGDTASLAAITIPDLDGNQIVGRNIFETSCAACHGAQGGGNPEAGPPLIHKIYEPSHHGDESFQRAVANGVRAHHWRFGDMPPVEGLTRGNVAMVIDYIRAVQRANGIN
ncbi:MAG: hypothetical protein EpisKO_42220 [Epibacterium sp.]